jgi:hypothetical protein
MILVGEKRNSGVSRVRPEFFLPGIIVSWLAPAG